MSKVSRSAVLVVVCFIAIISAGAVYAGVRYSITDVGFNGANYINNNGMAAGVGIVPGQGLNAFTWQNGQTNILQPLQGNCTFTIVRGINDSGQVVGTLMMDYVEHGVLWNTGSATDLGEGWANGISNSGVIIGTSGAPNSSSGYIRNGDNITSLNDLLGVQSLRPEYITSNGLIHIAILDGLNSSDAIWDGANLTPVQTPGVFGSMNDSGQVTGMVQNPESNKGHGFIWTAGTVTELTGIGDTFIYSESSAINNLGQVVGAAVGKNDNAYNNGIITEERIACLWENGVAYNLNDLIAPGTGWNLLHATDINESGQIVGYGTLNGVHTSFVLTPVPEPASMFALLSGFAGLAVARRRKKQY